MDDKICYKLFTYVFEITPLNIFPNSMRIQAKFINVNYTTMGK